MRTFIETVVFFWIAPLGLIWILTSLYKKALIRKVTQLKSTSNKVEHFSLPKGFDKVNFFVNFEGENADQTDEPNKQDNFQVIANGKDVNQYISYYYSTDGMLGVKIPRKELSEVNTLEIKHENNIPITITIQGEVKRVRQTVIILLILVIIGSGAVIYNLTIGLGGKNYCEFDHTKFQEFAKHPIDKCLCEGRGNGISPARWVCQGG